MSFFVVKSLPPQRKETKATRRGEHTGRNRGGGWNAEGSPCDAKTAYAEPSDVSQAVGVGQSFVKDVVWVSGLREIEVSIRKERVNALGRVRESAQGNAPQ